jgi:glycosyltransferase involved in cell wall biosynthesis
MVRLLPEDRFRCSIATFATYADLVAADRFPCPVHLFPLRHAYDWNAVRTAFRLAWLIRREGVSIVHTFFPTSDLFGGAVAKLSGCPVLISSRRDMAFQRTGLHRAAYRIAAPWFDQVHAVADQVREYHIEQDGLRPNQVVTVHNGVDLNMIEATPKLPNLAQFGIGCPAKVVACVGNIRRVKGLDILLRAAGIVCSRRPGTHFLIVGAVQDTEYMRELSDSVARLHLEGNVIFSGQRADVISILKACNVFFLPSRSEGFSNALLEAMACGLPCVATDVGGNREVVTDGETGYLVETENPTVAADRLLELLLNPEAARRMGAEGRRIVEQQFTTGSMIRQLIGLYDALLAKHGEVDSDDEHFDMPKRQRAETTLLQ